ncbi:MAG: L-threonylcarbamoyladenylate synthase [Nitrospirota bacterium]
MFIKISENNLADVLKKAVAVLNDGGIVAYPAETFYGLGVKFDKEASLRKLYELKKRPKEKPMPLIIGSRASLSMIAVSVNEIAESLMDKFWPGPLTLLLKAKKGLSPYLTAGTGRIAVRIPGESAALYLVREAGFPITATSANPSGMPPAEDADAVIRYFGGEIDMVIDGGRTAGGLPSTIADATEKRIKIVREGVITRSVLEKHLP